MKSQFYPLLFKKNIESPSTSASGTMCVQKGVVNLSFSQQTSLQNNIKAYPGENKRRMLILFIETLMLDY